MEIAERAYTRRLVRFAERYALALLAVSAAWPFICRADVHIFRLLLPAGDLHGYDIDWIEGFGGIGGIIHRFGNEMAGPAIELYVGMAAIGVMGPMLFVGLAALLHTLPDADRNRLWLSFPRSIVFKLPKDQRIDLMTRLRPLYALGFAPIGLASALGYDLDTSGRNAWISAIGHSDFAAAGLYLGLFNLLGACASLLAFLIAWRTANLRALPKIGG